MRKYSNSMSSLLESYLDVLYAKEILDKLPGVIKQKCGGCQRESLSQVNHVCIALSKYRIVLTLR